MTDCREGELEVTVSVAGGDPFRTASFWLTTADATPGVLISTLEDGYLTIWATGLGANGRKWYVPNHSGNSRSESRVWRAACPTVDWQPAAGQTRESGVPDG